MGSSSDTVTLTVIAFARVNASGVMTQHLTYPVVYSMTLDAGLIPETSAFLIITS